jgi:hypothetical protein
MLALRTGQLRCKVPQLPLLLLTAASLAAASALVLGMPLAGWQ